MISLQFSKTDCLYFYPLRTEHTSLVDGEVVMDYCHDPAVKNSKARAENEILLTLFNSPGIRLSGSNQISFRT